MSFFSSLGGIDPLSPRTATTIAAFVILCLIAMVVASRIFGIKFAPLFIPLRRRLQTLAVLILFPSQLYALVLFACITMFAPYGYAISAAYVAYMMLDKKPAKGGYPSSSWFKAVVVAFWRPLLRLFASYFPVEIIKTDDLDPTKRYIFGCHPHGVLSTGAFCAFCTDYCGFEQKYPGINLNVLTLKQTFKIPIFREFIMCHKLADCSKRSINYLLKKKGSAVLLVVGGAQEALDTRPGTLDLTLKSRKGFVKQALRNGARLVPVIVFGENELFSQLPNPKGSVVRAFQQLFKRIMGFSTPFFFGRGVFNYSFGLLPRRMPLHVVVGSPIKIADDDTPIQEPEQSVIDKVHAQYCEELVALYNAHKEKFAKNRTREICIK